MAKISYHDTQTFLLYPIYLIHGMLTTIYAKKVFNVIFKHLIIYFTL